MNYQVIFSTYNNKTKKTGSLINLEKFLVGLTKEYNIQGFSITSQLGFWAGEFEKSYILTIFDISKATAIDIAKDINEYYNQESSIIKPIKEEVYFINNEEYNKWI